MRHRVLGMLLVASGVLFLAAVLNPAVLPHWGVTRQLSRAVRPAG